MPRDIVTRAPSAGGQGGGPRASVGVIGAGAAGLTAALRAAQAGAGVQLWNAHPKLGLKILMSGGTRCNVTHREVSERDFHGGSPRFVAHVLRAFPAEAAVRWMESIGVALKLEPTGKYFPTSDDAHTVLDALVSAVQRAGVTVVSGARVVRLLAPAAPGAPFRVGVQRVRNSNAFTDAVAARGRTVWPLPSEEPDEWFEVGRVILASGGLSFPRTGSDGTGFALAAALGHTIVPTVPALTPLTSSDSLCARVQGITVPAELTLHSSGHPGLSISGSLLIAHFGFSGPAALDLSRHWLRASERGAVSVTANFLPKENRELLLASWRAAAAHGSSLRKWIAGRIPERLMEVLAEEAGVAPGALMSQIDRERRAVFLERLCARPLAVNGTLGYEKAEVTAGGVALDEVDSRTLESRIVPGLFFCGEGLDVEGRLGGFNFQWAWSSGTVAGRAAASR